MADVVDPLAQGLAGLDPGMRAALLWLPAYGTERGSADRGVLVGLTRLRDRGLCALRHSGAKWVGTWRATEQGLELRTALGAGRPFDR